MDRDEILKKYGVTEINRYCLINNYGSTFKLNGIKYDARFWANCYGAYIGKWKIHFCGDPGKKKLKSNLEIIKKIQQELNENECE